MSTFKLPDLGEGLQEAEIVEWHVAVGDRVVADQPLLSVETDKAIVEVPAPRTGRVNALLAGPGDVVRTGQPLVDLGTRDSPGADPGAVVGTVERGSVVEREAPAALPGRNQGGVKATPAVRALARRLEVDLSIVTPGGPDGVVTRADVERAARVLRDKGPLERLRGVRRTMAARMARAHAEVVPVTVCDDADVDAWTRQKDLTMRLIRALVAGCRVEPALNAWFDGHAVGRRLLETIDLGVAVDTPDGLFVPVLRDVGNRDAGDLRHALDRMKADVRARSIPPEEMRGYSLTLSNFGTYAGRYANPVVQPPAVAILGAGRMRPEVVAAGGVPCVHRVLPLSLTFDHRAVTGGEAARFLAAVIEDLVQPS